MSKNQERSLKISSSQRDNKQVPELRLSGTWMRELGFEVGERVTVTTREELLIITPSKELEAQEDCKAKLDKVREILKGLM